MVELILGFAIPVVLAPFVIWGLRYTFAIFLNEGDDLFCHTWVTTAESRRIGGVLATTNVLIFLVTWMAWLSCDYTGQPTDLLLGIALGGVGLALGATVLVLHLMLNLSGWILTIVAMLSFVGGNLPLVLIVPLLMVLL